MRRTPMSQPRKSFVTESGAGLFQDSTRGRSKEREKKGSSQIRETNVAELGYEASLYSRTLKRLPESCYVENSIDLNELTRLGYQYALNPKDGRIESITPPFKNRPGM